MTSEQKQTGSTGTKTMDAGDGFPVVLTDDTTEPHRLQNAILAAHRYHNVPSPKVLG